jgi:hypothetical protein
MLSFSIIPRFNEFRSLKTNLTTSENYKALLNVLCYSIFNLGFKTKKSPKKSLREFHKSKISINLIDLSCREFLLFLLRGSVHFDRFALFQFIFSWWKSFANSKFSNKNIFERKMPLLSSLCLIWFSSDRFFSRYKSSSEKTHCKTRVCYESCLNYVKISFTFFY